MDKVLIYHRGLDRTVAIPASVAPAWCAEGWELAPKTGPHSEVARLGAEAELAASDAASAQAAEEAVATIKQRKAAKADAVETANTTKENI